MRTHFNIFPFLIVLILAVGCKKDNNDEKDDDPMATCGTGNAVPQGTLRLQFLANTEGNAFALNQSFNNISNYRVEVEKLKFYLSDIRALDALNVANQIKDVAFIDFNDGSFFVDIPMDTGTYNGLQYGLGVPSTMNINHDPSVYPNDHPLSIFNQMHWSWNSGYIFSKMDGRADTTSSGTGLYDLSFTFHCGSDTMYREKDYSASAFAITEGAVTNFDIDFNISRLFYNASDTIDLKVDNATATANNLPLAIRFMDLFTDAMSHP